MRSIADLFCLVARRHLEFNFLSVDADHLGFGTDFMTDGRSSKVPYIDRGTERALTRIQKWPNGIESGVFHDQDHDGSRQHLRQHGIFELIGEMLRQHTHAERCLRSRRYFAHSALLSACRFTYAPARTNGLAVC